MVGQASPLAGKTIDPSMLINVPRLVTAYFTGEPDPTVPSQRVAFGTSGHRGSAFDNAFNEAHILAISQAICRYRSRSRITGPLFVESTHTRCPNPPSQARSRYLPPMTSMR